MIITRDIQQLVHKIESETQIKPFLKLLFQQLQINCQEHALHERQYYKNLPVLETPYPIVDGYAVSFDPLTQEKQILEHWYQYGFVVGKNVATANQCDDVVKTMQNIMNQVGMGLEDESTWKKDDNGTALLSRGFFELYHDDVLAQIRQNIRLYLYHVILWENPFLWTSFDRLGLKLPEGQESKGLPLHVDQNPTVHADFTTVQGVLALVDCPQERGTFVGVPGSKKYFSKYASYIKEGYKGEYIPLPEESGIYQELSQRQQCIPLKKGNIVSWDSRTTHANSDNLSSLNRYVMYVATGVAKEYDEQLVEKRKLNFRSGLGENVRDAYLHASKKPRFTNADLMSQLRKTEQLNELGLCLYGLKKYEDVMQEGEQ
jgi:hypothetical protein